LKPARANSSQDPISKNPSQKTADGVAQGVGPEFKPQYHPKKKKKKTQPTLRSMFLPIILVMIKTFENIILNTWEKLYISGGNTD
jgi:hypothetical protein